MLRAASVKEVGLELVKERKGDEEVEIAGARANAALAEFDLQVQVARRLGTVEVSRAAVRDGRNPVG